MGSVGALAVAAGEISGLAAVSTASLEQPAKAGLPQFFTATPVPAAYAADLGQVRPQNEAEPGLLEGKEREKKFQELREFYKQFVDESGFKVLVEDGFYVEEPLSVRVRRLPNSEITTFYVDVEGSRVTFASIEKSKGRYTKQATIFAERGGLDMDGFALAVKSLLRYPQAEFIEQDFNDSDDFQPPFQLLGSREESLDLSEYKVLRADIPYQQDNFAADQFYLPVFNYVQLLPSGQIIFHQEVKENIKFA